MSFFNTDVLNTQSVFTTDFNLNHISLSGYSLFDTTTLFNALKNQKPQTLNFYDELPDNPISFSAIALSDPKLFYSNLKILKTKFKNPIIRIFQYRKKTS